MDEHRESYERDESTAHRLDRNYSELLQELRVAQMGIQILFAFLLGIAFQQLDVLEGTVAASIATASAAVVFGYLWLLLPLRWRKRANDPSTEGPWE